MIITPDQVFFKVKAILKHHFQTGSILEAHIGETFHPGDPIAGFDDGANISHFQFGLERLDAAASRRNSAVIRSDMKLLKLLIIDCTLVCGECAIDDCNTSATIEGSSRKCDCWVCDLSPSLPGKGDRVRFFSTLSTRDGILVELFDQVNQQLYGVVVIVTVDDRAGNGYGGRRRTTTVGTPVSCRWIEAAIRRATLRI
jgi:hypothetical protein